MLKEITLAVSLLMDKGPAVTNSPSPDLSPQPRSIASEELTIAEDPILAEAKNLGIEESDFEKELWSIEFDNLGLTQEEVADLSPDEMGVLAEHKLFFVLDNMFLSENPQFNKAGNFFYNISSKNRLYSEWYSDGGGLTAQPGVSDDGEFVITFSIDPKDILGADQLELAHGFTGLSIMGRETNKKFKSLPDSLTPEEIVRKLDGTPEDQISLATKAIANEAQSCINEAGLLGETACGPGTEEVTEIYIQTGSDPNSPEWRKYIEDGVFIVTPQPQIETEYLA